MSNTEQTPVQRTTGLSLVTSGENYKSGRKRKCLPTRTGLIWTEGVLVVGNVKSNTPSVVCRWCRKTFSGGATRVREHYLGGSGSISICPADSDAFCQFKDKLDSQSVDNTTRKQQRTLDSIVDRNVQRGRVSDVMRIGGEREQRIDNETPSFEYARRPQENQRAIESVLHGPKQERALDLHIAEFIYANNLPFAIVTSETFKAMIRAAKCAPASYKPPTEHSLSNKLLDATVELLQKENAPIREVMISNGLSIVCDGWEDNERNHLINLLLASNSRSIFDGTVELTSFEHEDAATVAKLIIEAIDRAGPLNVIQVVTDTCSVMRAAWKIIESRYQWITCTPCAPHSLSLLLKSIANIPAVAGVLTRAKAILNRFCGHKRWPRKRLREVRLVQST